MFAKILISQVISLYCISNYICINLSQRNKLARKLLEHIKKTEEVVLNINRLSVVIKMRVICFKTNNQYKSLI